MADNPQAQELTKELIEQSKEAANEVSDTDELRKTTSFKVPPDIRKSKMDFIQELLERE
jgi:hypothetical protein